MYLWLWLRYAIGDRISTFWQANLDQIATFWQANLDCHIFAHYGIGFPRFSKLTWIRLPSFGILWIKLPHSSKLTFERIATFWHANSLTLDSMREPLFGSIARSSVVLIYVKDMVDFLYWYYIICEGLFGIIGCWFVCRTNVSVMWLSRIGVLWCYKGESTDMECDEWGIGAAYLRNHQRVSDRLAWLIVA